MLGETGDAHSRTTDADTAIARPNKIPILEHFGIIPALYHG